MDYRPLSINHDVFPRSIGGLLLAARQYAPNRTFTTNGGLHPQKLSYDLPDSSYSPGLVSSPLHFWMPAFITDRLSKGFQQFGKSSHGFLTNEAVMIGVETRTSLRYGSCEIMRHCNMSLSMGYFLVEKEQVTPEELFQQVSMEKNVLKQQPLI